VTSTVAWHNVYDAPLTVVRALRMKRCGPRAINGAACVVQLPCRPALRARAADDCRRSLACSCIRTSRTDAYTCFTNFLDRAFTPFQSKESSCVFIGKPSR
jgi:hypothetical protein